MGCNETKPKKEMIRIVRTPDGNILLDSKGKLSGRGVYICPKADCFAKAKKAKRLERSLEVQIPEDIYSALEEKISQMTEDMEVQS